MIGLPNGLKIEWPNKLNKGLVHQSWKANGAPSRSDVQTQIVQAAVHTIPSVPL